jgi:hypothetical protein
MSFPHGWHKMPVWPPPEVGLKLDAEIWHRIQNLPEALRNSRMYQNRHFWYNFLAWMHTARRRSAFHDD